MDSVLACGQCVRGYPERDGGGGGGLGQVQAYFRSQDGGSIPTKETIKQKPLKKEAQKKDFAEKREKYVETGADGQNKNVLTFEEKKRKKYV